VPYTYEDFAQNQAQSVIKELDYSQVPAQGSKQPLLQPLTKDEYKAPDIGRTRLRTASQNLPTKRQFQETDGSQIQCEQIPSVGGLNMTSCRYGIDAETFKTCEASQGLQATYVAAIAYTMSKSTVEKTVVDALLPQLWKMVSGVGGYLAIFTSVFTTIFVIKRAQALPVRTMAFAGSIIPDEGGARGGLIASTHTPAAPASAGNSFDVGDRRH